MLKTAIHFRVVLFFILLLNSSCNTQQPMLVSVPAKTPDLCGPGALPGEVEKVQKNMREFDDASLLAVNTPRNQLTSVISNMQRIRREAEDQVVPPCLAILKQVQLVHMKTEVETLIAFLGGANQKILSQGIALARQQHNQYTLEYARLLGLTMVVPSTNTPSVVVTDPSQSVNTNNYVAVNSGVENLNLFAQPSQGASVVAILAVGESTRILSKNSDGQWLMVERPGQPGQTAWVMASKVTLAPSQ